MWSPYITASHNPYFENWYSSGSQTVGNDTSGLWANLVGLENVGWHQLWWSHSFWGCYPVITRHSGALPGWHTANKAGWGAKKIGKNCPSERQLVYLAQYCLYCTSWGFFQSPTWKFQGLNLVLQSFATPFQAAHNVQVLWPKHLRPLPLTGQLLLITSRGNAQGHSGRKGNEIKLMNTFFPVLPKRQIHSSFDD